MVYCQVIKLGQLFYLSLVLLASCKNSTRESKSVNNAVIASAFIDAFYSFDKDSLQDILSAAEISQPEILYYQQWARCGNYKVLQRDRYYEKNDSIVIFPVTVKDDLIGALQLDLNVSDTFHITILDGKIRKVETSSNDPDAYYEAKAWVKEHHPEYIDKACEGIWNGGPTPCECVQGMVMGFHDFMTQKAAR